MGALRLAGHWVGTHIYWLVGALSLGVCYDSVIFMN